MVKRQSSRRSSTRKPSRSSSRSRRRKPRPSLWQRLSPDQKLDLLGWFLVALSTLTILSMISAEQGVLTQWWITLLSQAFGWGRYVVPLLIGAIGLWLILRHFGEKLPRPDASQITGVILGMFTVLTTLHLVVSRIWPHVDLYSLARDGLGGGFIGAFLVAIGTAALGSAGLTVALILLWIATVTLVASVSPSEALTAFIEWWRRRARAQQTSGQSTTSPEASPETQERQNDRPKAIVLGDTADTRDAHPTPSSAPTIHASARPGNGEVHIPPVEAGRQTWTLPKVTAILEEGSEQYYSEDLIRKQVRIIEETLSSLGAPARVNEINQGPVVTQFGVEPLFVSSRGGKQTKVKVSKIASLADDLALALSARSIRVQAPIPGKGLVGIEVPNEEPMLVSLRDVMESESFARLKGRLRIGLGQDVSGRAVAADLRAMPHLLIAGATGSGKSVCVNAIISAFLLQNTPDTLRLIMVDPKRVELTQYNGIPHLLAPVIVDIDRVVPTLRWATREMDGRYRRFADIGARNIEDYNRRVQKTGEGVPIPYIAIIVDELADVIIQAPDEAERVICRLAQMARATGIHLIIATQRPSVDVVTGLIKANFPARIAFAVASSVDSRVILDMPGAERLLGQGDMLFMPPDVSQPLRLQGAFVSDREIERLITYWRTAALQASQAGDLERESPEETALAAAVTQPSLFPTFEDPSASQTTLEDDLMPAAVEIFLAENRCSTSLLQRRLRIGYTRAARLMDTLTEMGIVANEVQGHSRKVNRVLAEKFLRSLNAEGPADADEPPF